MSNSDQNYTLDSRRTLQEPAPAPQALLVQNPRNTPTPATAVSQNPQVPLQQALPPNLNLSGLMHSDAQQINFGSVFANDLSNMPQLQQQLNQSISMQPNLMSQQQLLQQHFQQQMPSSTTQQQLTTQQQPQQTTQQQQQQVPPQQQLQSQLPQPQQLQQHQPNNDYLRSLMNQKIQFPSNIFDDHVRQRFMAAPAEPLLQPQLMNDPRFLIGPGGGLAGLHPSLTNSRSFALPSPHELTLRDENRRMRGGVIEPFPEKLHRLLTEVEVSGRGDVISFIANGKAFAIHKPDKFFKEIVPKYFRQSRLSSFKRQLNLYGFELINTGPARGGYYHEMFTKERPELCRRMRRIAIKLQNNKGNDEEKPKSPDFFDMQAGATKTTTGGEQQQSQITEEGLQNNFRANAAA